MHASSSVAARSASMQLLRNSALVALVLLSAIMYPVEFGCLCEETMILVVGQLMISFSFKIHEIKPLVGRLPLQT